MESPNIDIQIENNDYLQDWSGVATLGSELNSDLRR